MTFLGLSVAHRFSTQQPPHWLKGAVASGELAPESLDVWSAISVELGRNFEMVSAVSYWENEMRTRGILLPRKLIPPFSSEVESDETVSEWRQQFNASSAMQSIFVKISKSPGVEQRLGQFFARHRTHHNPTVEFEKQYQFHLIVIRKHLARKTYDSADDERLEALLHRLDKLLSQAGT